MREILFRGKRSDTGDWVQGFYIQKPNPFSEDGKPIRHCIIDLPPFGYDVDPETVGQFTGLCDKNGNRIFEGDVVVIETDCIPSFMLNRYVFVWDDDQTAYKLLKDNTIYDLPMGRMEIIGNIYDNPELLEEVSDGSPKD